MVYVVGTSTNSIPASPPAIVQPATKPSAGNTSSVQVNTGQGGNPLAGAGFGTPSIHTSQTLPTPVNVQVTVVNGGATPSTTPSANQKMSPTEGAASYAKSVEKLSVPVLNKDGTLSPIYAQSIRDQLNDGKLGAKTYESVVQSLPKLDGSPTTAQLVAQDVANGVEASKSPTFQQLKRLGLGSDYHSLRDTIVELNDKNGVGKTDFAAMDKDFTKYSVDKLKSNPPGTLPEVTEFNTKIKPMLNPLFVATFQNVQLGNMAEFDSVMKDVHPSMREAAMRAAMPNMLASAPAATTTSTVVPPAATNAPTLTPPPPPAPAATPPQVATPPAAAPQQTLGLGTPPGLIAPPGQVAGQQQMSPTLQNALAATAMYNDPNTVAQPVPAGQTFDQKRRHDLAAAFGTMGSNGAPIGRDDLARAGLLPAEQVLALAAYNRALAVRNKNLTPAAAIRDTENYVDDVHSVAKARPTNSSTGTGAGAVGVHIGIDMFRSGGPKLNGNYSSDEKRQLQTEAAFLRPYLPIDEQPGFNQPNQPQNGNLFNRMRRGPTRYGNNGFN